MNNCEGTLLLMPFAANLKWYEIELAKSGSFIKLIFELLANNTDCSLEEAAQCILTVFCNKFDNSFATAAIDKCILLEENENIMGIISAEARISEAVITVERSRVNDQHFNQFFGR
jgi:hypothetical protein